MSTLLVLLPTLSFITIIKKSRDVLNVTSKFPKVNGTGIYIRWFLGYFPLKFALNGM